MMSKGSKVHRFAWIVAALVLGASLGPALAGETVVDDDGILNPQDLSVDYWARRIDEKPFDPSMCWVGYPALKLGNHPAARRILERCAREGMEGAMPAISASEENGIDKPSNPEAAAEWDRKLADKGSSLGAFNYGLDLLRGHGVRQDLVAGRAMIDRAARGGDTTAKELAAHGYDPESVTPDADKPRYRLPGS